MAEPPLQVGDTVVTAQFSPCVGGLVRTWVDGAESRLWSTPDADWLRGIQATGAVGRTLREERRFREAALLSQSGGSLIVQPRLPAEADSGDDEVRRSPHSSDAGSTSQFDAKVLRLEPPGQPVGSVADDFRALLAQAVRHCVTSHEFLVVEKGGWDAPTEPFCLFIVVAEQDGHRSVVETSPPPDGSPIWAPHIVAGREIASLSAPAKPETIDVVPVLMIEAISRWGLEPWDLALTFGHR